MGLAVAARVKDLLTFSGGGDATGSGELYSVRLQFRRRARRRARRLASGLLALLAALALERLRRDRRRHRARRGRRPAVRAARRTPAWPARRSRSCRSRARRPNSPRVSTRASTRRPPQRQIAVAPPTSARYLVRGYLSASLVAGRGGGRLRLGRLHRRQAARAAAERRDRVRGLGRRSLGDGQRGGARQRRGQKRRRSGRLSVEHAGSRARGAALSYAQ